MRAWIYFVTIVAFALLVGAACNSAEQKPPDIVAAHTPNPTQTQPGDGIRRITVPELKELLARDQAVVIDVRNQGAYNQGHITGAKLIPATEIQLHLSELPKDKTIVTYCS